MFTEIIGRSTVKVGISPEELKNFGLNYENIKEDDPQTRGLIIYILGEITRSEGADLWERELYIEVFPTDTGGCLMYISDSRGNDLIKRPRGRKRGKENRADKPLPELVFSCRTAGELSECAELLMMQSGKYLCGSSLYYSHEDFRLILTVKKPSVNFDIPFSIAAAYTREHYSLLIPEKAVEKLSGLIP